MNPRTNFPYCAVAALALTAIFFGGELQAQARPQSTENENRIAVLVTGWGPPSGYSAEFNASVYDRAVVGDRAIAADEPCTEWYLGTFPYRTEFGRIPYALAWKGSDVSILYVTHGQPWPGSNPERGPMTAGW